MKRICSTDGVLPSETPNSAVGEQGFTEQSLAPAKTPSPGRTEAASFRPNGADDAAALMEMYHQMLRIRSFEERAAALFRDDKVPGFLHLSIGQEAVAVGVCHCLHREDVITSTHRGHGHVLAKGADMTGMFAEIMGKKGGTCGGRGGSMHIADVSIGIFGANGIVAGGLPIAVGAALAHKLSRSTSVVVAFFGDGAVSQGAFHEAVTMAQHFKVPILFVCENNQYAEFTRTGGADAVSLEHRAGGYDLPYWHVDGNDVEAVARITAQLVEELRAGGPPSLLEAVTLRVRGHYEGDAQAYRDDALDLPVSSYDPLYLAEQRLVALGVHDTTLGKLRGEVESEIETAVTESSIDSEPEPGELLLHVFGEREIPPSAATVEPQAGGEPISMIRAIRAALHDALEEDHSVFLAGIDIGAGGNVFNVTRGLYDAFPDRVLDTPIAEAGIVGLGVGASMAGMRPVVEIMYFDFIGVCLDQLMNQAAKLRYMTGGGTHVPLTVRTQFGAGHSSGAQHSQSLEALLAHIPGLTVVMPATPLDAYGLLRSAIDDSNPVIFVENRLQYGEKGPPAPPGYRVPLGKASVVRSGGDVTIVALSRMVQTALAAAEELARDGVDSEVIDLRTVTPLDMETILASVAETHRLVIVHEAVLDFGVGAEIAASVASKGIWDLDAPIARVGAAYSPAPYAPSLEHAWLPNTHKVTTAVRQILERTYGETG